VENLWYFLFETEKLCYHKGVIGLRPNIRFLPSIVAEKNAPKNILDGRQDGRTEITSLHLLPIFYRLFYSRCVEALQNNQ
jgi:hypothetical protein